MACSATATWSAAASTAFWYDTRSAADGDAEDDPEPVAVVAVEAAIVGGDLSARCLALRSSANVAAATLAPALLTVEANAAESMVASTCPTVTVSPALTFTAMTVSADEKASESVAAMATVPLADIVLLNAPVVVLVDDRPKSHQPPRARTAPIGMITKGWSRGLAR